MAEPRIEKAKVRLREAAVLWAKASRIPSSDPEDREFKKIDEALMKAARDYVEELDG